ncbi:unnamed protein product, partial [Didymodactylos carnosus]
RICGLLFCSRCCSYDSSTQINKSTGYTQESNLRLCSYCSSTLKQQQKFSLSSSSTAQILPTQLISKSDFSDNISIPPLQSQLLMMTNRQELEQQNLDTININCTSTTSDRFSISHKLDEYVMND